MPLVERGTVSPAHAGMYPLEGLGSALAQSIVSPAHAGMYPNESNQRALMLFLVSPAHAGMYPTWNGTSTMSAKLSFPRTRGDVPHVTALNDYRLGHPPFPPHTRGCTVLQGDVCQLFRVDVSPAHAGMYPAQ